MLLEKATSIKDKKNSIDPTVQYEFSKIRALHGYLKEIGYSDSHFNFASLAWS
jgi:hypothetical protein